MDNWLILALIAPAILSIVYFLDKYVLEHKVQDYRGMPIFGAIAAFVFGTLVWIGSGFPIIQLKDAALVIFTGMFTVWGYALYFNALSKTQTSYIISLSQLTPVFTLILAIVFLGEIVTLQMYAGFVLILFSAIALSFKKEKIGFTLNSSFYVVLLANVVYAIANIFIKFALEANTFNTIFAYESWGIAIGGAILFATSPTIRQSFKRTYHSVGKSVLGFVFFNELLFTISKVFTFLAIALGPVAIVSVLSSTTVFYGLIIGWILTLFAPKIFKEDINSKALAIKFIFITLVFIGIWLIQA